MLVLLVTGVAGSGTSTVAWKLADWGHHAIDLDNDHLIHTRDSDHDPHDTRSGQPDTHPLGAYGRTWNSDRLDTIISTARDAGTDTLWLCGRATNAHDLADRFDAYLQLEIDQTTMRRRLSAPGQDGGVGRTDATLTSAIAGYRTFVATWRRWGATTIDATQDPDQVCQELLMAAAFAAMHRQAGT